MRKINFNPIYLFTGLIFIILSSCAGSQQGVMTGKSAATTNGYSVINPGEPIIMYKYTHTGHSAKDVDKYAPKYYFTSASSDVLKDLTKNNIKKAYPTNHTFHDAIDANFTNDQELINFDEFHKMYKLNRLYQNGNSTMSSMNEPMNHDKMKMDNSMMSSMHGTMDKMHTMKMSGDFDHDFAHMMVMHHQAAIEMSEFEIANGTDAKTKSMAKDIISVQRTEIGQLQAFIKNYKVPEVKTTDMHHGLGDGMKTMMDKMNNMKMTGNVDKDYVMMMIHHHECAITMAEDELTHGKHMELRKIAQNIITDQKKEVAEFKVLRSNLR